MKLPTETELRLLQIRCLKMINGLLSFTYIALLVWLVAQVVKMITG